MRQHLSPKVFGTALGVSESSLKRWIDEGLIKASRTAGGHRRIPIAEAVRFIHETGKRVQDPTVLGLTHLADLQPGKDGQIPNTSTLQRFLLEGDTRSARDLIVSLYVMGQGLTDIFDGPVAAAMHEIGTLWEHRPEGVFLEHRATDICLQAVHQLQHLCSFGLDGKRAPLAIGGAPSGDPYLLPSMMVATVLGDLGWRADNLGPDTPFESVRDAVAATRPQLVWFSVTTQEQADRAVKGIRELARDLETDSIPVVVGGQSLPDTIANAPANLHQVTCMAELAAFARGVKVSLKPRSKRKR